MAVALLTITRRRSPGLIPGGGLEFLTRIPGTLKTQKFQTHSSRQLFQMLVRCKKKLIAIINKKTLLILQNFIKTKVHFNENYQNLFKLK